MVSGRSLGHEPVLLSHKRPWRKPSYDAAITTAASIESTRSRTTIRSDIVDMVGLVTLAEGIVVHERVEGTQQRAQRWWRDRYRPPMTFRIRDAESDRPGSSRMCLCIAHAGHHPLGRSLLPSIRRRGRRVGGLFSSFSSLGRRAVDILPSLHPAFPPDIKRPPSCNSGTKLQAYSDF